MTGKDVLLAQLRYLKKWFNRSQNKIDNPAVKKLAEIYEVPNDLYGAFTAYCADFLLEREGCLNESGIFWEEDNLHGIISKWHTFFRPIADMVESDLNDQVCLDVYVEPSYISMTTIIITADVKSGQETLAFKYQLKAQNVIEQETFLEMLEAYYNSLYMSIKELTDIEQNNKTEGDLKITHIYAQDYWHDNSFIVANKEGLLALKRAIEEALKEQHAKADVMTADGEGYSTHILCLQEDWQSEKWQKLMLPYTDECAKDSRENMIQPCQLLPEKVKSNKIRVVIVEPGNEPKEKGISNTLEELQNIVGGYIEAIPLHNEIGSDLNIVCNEEGKLLGLPLNRALDSDILCGTFIVVKSDEDNFVSLTDDEVKNVKDRFALSGYSFK